MASEAVKKSDRPPDEEREPAGTGTASEEEGIDALLGEPAHHARRPMNAFLIFCKRHRSVVRDRYPHLENRSITKILGEWWANLEPSEKGSYTELARQYKEAFLRANPDFKWYKLPAPPLRTLITRPSNQNKPHKLECQLTCGPITPGKLADESQMGGLSSLLASPPTTPTSLTPTSPTVPKPPKKRYLQEALLEANLATLPEEKLEEEQNGDLSFSQGEKFTSDFKVNYPSPFTKLRNHAVNQLNSIQERKTNRRRSSGDFKIMDTKTAFAKLKSTSNNLVMKSSSVIKSVITTNLPEKEVDDSAAYTPSEKSNLTRVNSFCNEREELVNGSSYINSSKSLSLETTIKASQQQIIDRVVDKLCGFSESLQQQQPVSPTMCSTTNAVSPQRSTSSPPPKASVIYSNIFMPNSPLRSESIDSFAVVENCKYNTDSENISSKHQECETRTINNNVYNNKDAALEMCKSEEMSRCRSEAAYTTMFYTTSSLEEQSLEAKDWQTKNFGASAHYFESMEGTKISRDGNSENNCDNCSETAPVIPDVAEPKALETSSRLSCQETSACQFPRTNSSEGEQNFSCMFENDCGSQFVDVTGNRMDLLPKFDSGLGIMEENRLVFPPLYSNNTTAKTILVHNPPTSITKIDNCLRSENRIKGLEHSPKFDSIETHKTLEHGVKSSPFSFASKLPSKSDNDSSSELASVGVSRSNPSREHNGSSGLGLEMCTDNISKTVPITGSESVNFVSNSYDITRPKKLASCSSRSPLMVNLSTDTVCGANNVDINNSVKQDNCEDENKLKTSQENIIGLSTEECDELERRKSDKCIISEPAKLSLKSGGSFLNISNDEVTFPQQQQQQQNLRRKSLRACKGQRYREFMNEGRLALGKRMKRALVTGGESGTHAELISAVSKRDRHESGSSTTSDRTESAFSEGSREMELEFQQLQTAKSPLVLARKDSHTISKQQNNNKKPSSIGKTSSVFKDALSTTVNSPEKKSRKHSDVSEDSFSDSSPKKRFRAADFNLDEKIEALPSLSLEEFQLKKKQRKKRNLMTLGGSAKKSMITTTAISAKSSTSSQDPIPQNTISENGFKRSQSPEETSLIKSTSPPISGSNIVTTIIATVTATTITNSSPARMTPLVGSQKRKARKQCIMRLDPENAHTSRDTAVVEPDVLNNIGLATLAEVAAAKRKLAK